MASYERRRVKKYINQVAFSSAEILQKYQGKRASLLLVTLDWLIHGGAGSKLIPFLIRGESAVHWTLMVPQVQMEDSPRTERGTTITLLCGKKNRNISKIHASERHVRLLPVPINYKEVINRQRHLGRSLVANQGEIILSSTAISILSRKIAAWVHLN